MSKEGERGREGGREGVREGGREGGREGVREEGREGERERERVVRGLRVGSTDTCADIHTHIRTSSTWYSIITCACFRLVL